MWNGDDDTGEISVEIENNFLKDFDDAALQAFICLSKSEESNKKLIKSESRVLVVSWVMLVMLVIRLLVNTAAILDQYYQHTSLISHISDQWMLVLL